MTAKTKGKAYKMKRTHIGALLIHALRTSLACNLAARETNEDRTPADKSLDFSRNGEAWKSFSHKIRTAAIKRIAAGELTRETFRVVDTETREVYTVYGTIRECVDYCERWSIRIALGSQIE